MTIINRWRRRVEPSNLTQIFTHLAKDYYNEKELIQHTYQT